MERSVLEVSQWWGEELLDVRVYGPDERLVSIGTRAGRRWRFLGIDMGFVRGPVAVALAALPFGWSEVRRERRADFPVPELAEDWVLAERTGEDVAVHAPPGWAREEDGDAVVVRAGAFRFVIRRARAERVSQRFAVDLQSFGVTAAVVAALFAVGTLAAVAPRAEAVAVEVETIPVELVLRAPPPPAKVVPGPKAGGPSRRDREPRTKERRAPKVTTDRQIATSSGVLGVELDALGPSLAPSLLRAVGGLIGTRGTAIGRDGLGARGGGLGGGGDAEGLDGFGPSGIGFGGGPGGDGTGKVEGTLQATDEPIRLIGSLDPRQIDEVVKRHLASIRFCYQRELQHHAGLGGKVSVKFTIGADGAVSSARATGTLESEAVRGCIVNRFLGMTFPPPRGGGLVVVSYPFLFAAE